MAPFRNFLSKRAVAPNGGEADSSDGNGPSLESHRSNPVTVPSYEDSPKEYKLSGMLLMFNPLPPYVPADPLPLQLSMAMAPTFRYTLRLTALFENIG